MVKKVVEGGLSESGLRFWTNAITNRENCKYT